jgi:hypothetical protein
MIVANFSARLVASLILLLGLALRADVSLVVEPFVNASDFKKGTSVGTETAEILAAALAHDALPGLDVIRSAGVRAGTNNGSLFVVKGTMKKCDLSSLGIVSYGRGGATSLSAEVVFQASVLSNGKKIMETTVRTKKSDNDLGLTIIGGPGTSDELDAGDYSKIQKLSLKDPAFKGSVLGMAFYECASNLSVEIKNRLMPRRRLSILQVMDVAGDIIYFNGGSDVGIRTNDLLSVFEKNGDKQTWGQVARIRVTDILSGSFSKGLVLDPKRKIKKGDLIRGK